VAMEASTDLLGYSALPGVPSPSVLLVEDDQGIATQLVRGLIRGGYRVDHVLTGREALNWGEPDVVLLDLGLPDADGVHICRQLRERSASAIIVVTARGEEAERVLALDAGADDYLVKPFALTELLARVQALLRRSGRLRSVTTEVGDLVLDESASTAWRAGKPLDLTPTELQLLGYLLARRGRTVSKTELLTQVWGYGSYDPNLVEVRISSLRRKLEAAGPRIVHTVHGHGYTVRL